MSPGPGRPVSIRMCTSPFGADRAARLHATWNMRITVALLAAALFASCTTTTPGQSDLPQAPWRSDPIARTDVPAVYLEQWEKAENRDDCAPLILASLGEGMENATPRAATFSGGWAVAYDAPGARGMTSAGRVCADCGRGAFGIAGTGTTPEGSYEGWPHWKNWRDGSRAGYGPEGGTGPRDLAYVTVRGQGCLYNVWSFAGQEHLEHLLENLRTVR